MKNHIKARIEGLSAYEIAVLEGFKGTRAEWLESLKLKTTDLISMPASGNDVMYMIKFDDGSEYPIELKNGKEIESVTKTETNELTSTLNFMFNDGTSVTVEVPNGTGIKNIELADTNGLIDTYSITYTDREPTSFFVKNGVGIEKIEKTLTDGIVDTYTITFNDGTTQTYDVINSIDTEPMDFTPFFVEEFFYLIKSAAIGVHKFVPFVSESNPLIDSFLEADSHPYRDVNKRMKCVGVKVRAGQMFKISAHSISTISMTLIFAEGHDEPYIREVIEEPLDDYYYYVRKDGWIFVNSAKDFEGASVKKVTIFDEVEENQKLLNQAIGSIPTVEKVRDAVLAALPSAEGGAF